MSVRVLKAEPFVLNVRTRMPFRYGIATMTALPHVFLRAEVEVNGRATVGVSADHLPPKWFTKSPAESYRDEVAAMLAVIDSACAVATAAGRHKAVFDWWLHTYQGQMAWGGGWGQPPLLTNFGTSLVERAVIAAFCRAEGTTFSESTLRNDFGIRLGAVHQELDGSEPRDWLPERPLRSVIARHTVGLLDALTDADIPSAERLDDGLPESLEACVRAYGLTHFKIKLSDDAAADVDRLGRIADVLARTAGDDYACTLDGNECFTSVESFRDFWSRLASAPALGHFASRLLFVEQPIHRDVALTSEVATAFANWPGRPPVIIDESDAKLATTREALSLDYAGTSHKNCKGVFKGLLNACLLKHRRRTDPRRVTILSGEDLSNIGPIALHQDLAVVSTLGIPHVERNGHHYFKGLSIMPPDVRWATIARHPDLYRELPDGLVAVRIDGGRLRTGSVVDHGFGTDYGFDPSTFTPATAWSFDSLGIS